MCHTGSTAIIITCWSASRHTRRYNGTDHGNTYISIVVGTTATRLTITTVLTVAPLILTTHLGNATNFFCCRGQESKSFRISFCSLNLESYKVIPKSILRGLWVVGLQARGGLVSRIGSYARQDLVFTFRDFGLGVKGWLNRFRV